MWIIAYFHTFHIWELQKEKHSSLQNFQMVVCVTPKGRWFENSQKGNVNADLGSLALVWSAWWTRQAIGSILNWKAVAIGTKGHLVLIWLSTEMKTSIRWLSAKAERPLASHHVITIITWKCNARPPPSRLSPRWARGRGSAKGPPRGRPAPRQ